MTKEEIAEKVGRSVDTVRLAVRAASSGSDQDLALVMKTARDRAQGQYMRILERNGEIALRRLEDPEQADKIEFKDLAAMAREASKVAGFSDSGVQDGVTRPALQINVNDPAQLASFVEALRLLNEPQQRVIEINPVRED